MKAALLEHPGRVVDPRGGTTELCGDLTLGDAYRVITMMDFPHGADVMTPVGVLPPTAPIRELFPCGVGRDPSQVADELAVIAAWRQAAPPQGVGKVCASGVSDDGSGSEDEGASDGDMYADPGPMVDADWASRPEATLDREVPQVPARRGSLLSEVTRELSSMLGPPLARTSSK